MLFACADVIGINKGSSFVFVFYFSACKSLLYEHHGAVVVMEVVGVCGCTGTTVSQR